MAIYFINVLLDQAMHLYFVIMYYSFFQVRKSDIDWQFSFFQGTFWYPVEFQTIFYIFSLQG